MKGAEIALTGSVAVAEEPYSGVLDLVDEAGEPAPAGDGPEEVGQPPEGDVAADDGDAAGPALRVPAHQHYAGLRVQLQQLRQEVQRRHVRRPHVPPRRVPHVLQHPLPVALPSRRVR